MRQFKKLDSFDAFGKNNIAGAKLYKKPMFGVIIYEVDADGIDGLQLFNQDNSDDILADSMGATFYTGYGYIFEKKSDAKEFILQSANKYADDREDPELGKHGDIDLIELPDDNFIAIGGSSFGKLYKITTLPRINHAEYEEA